jgi:hypothetical protein
MMPADGALVGKHHVGVADAANDLPVLIRGAVIDRELAEGRKALPAQIAGIFRIAVQNDNFHDAAPPFKSGG